MSDNTKNTVKVDGMNIIYFILFIIYVIIFVVFYLVSKDLGMMLMFMISIIIFYSNSILISKNQELEDYNKKYYDFFIENDIQLKIIYDKLEKLDRNNIFSTDPELSAFFRILRELLTKHKILLYSET